MALWEKTLYINKDIGYLVNSEIIEYDIKSGGFNICKEFKLLPDRKITKLESMNKKDRQIQLGYYQREDKTLSKKLNEGFKECRKRLFEANDLKEEDIVSIKKDAIFTTKACPYNIFGNIEFRPKSFYTSYYYLNRIEFYYNNSVLDVKGISDDNLELHKNFMLAFLSNLFKCNESSSESYVRKTLKEFSDYYRNRALEIGYYRELNDDSCYRTYDKFMGNIVGIRETNDIKNLDITYNYMNFIVPLISILI